jgi:hypothetical protein
MLLDLDSILIDAVYNVSPNTRTPPKRKYNLYNRKRRTVTELVHQIFLQSENIQETLKHRCKYHCFSSSITALDISTICNPYVSKSASKKMNGSEITWTKMLLLMEVVLLLDGI